MTTQQQPTTHRKKLIEVDLPLDAINAESSREKSIRHGHPSTLHLWWARRPLASCRAVIFASMVDDPSACPDEFPTPEAVRAERRRLHELISELVKWENTDERKSEARALLNSARYEIARSVARSRSEPLPRDCSRDNPAATLRYLADSAKPIYDPFAGGGSIPLEAQRLGLKAIASDLNPVAVLINKALIELPHKFANRPPVNPDADPIGMLTGKSIGRGKNRKPEIIAWRGAAGLADDIRYYGNWMRQQAFNRIGSLYPKAKLPDGGEATVIAWLWARTVPCNNPICGADMPLLSSFELSTKKNNQHWIKPVVERGDEREPPRIRFVVQNHKDGVPSWDGTVIPGGKGARCVACGDGVDHTYIRDKSKEGSMRAVMTCIVAQGNRKRVFISPTDEHIQSAQNAKPAWRPTQSLPERALGFRVQRYGFTHWHQLFSERQLLTLTTFSKILSDARDMILDHGADEEYANIVLTYLAFAIDRTSDIGNSFCRWRNPSESIAGIFGRQAISMVWDFAECNTFSNSAGNWTAYAEWIAKAVERLPLDVNPGEAHQADAATTIHAESGPVIVTDPPYYDNIGYADLSDFFYVWLRPLLRDMNHEMFGGILTPKNEEMIAAPRFDKKGDENAKDRFERLMNATLRLIRQKCSPEFPSSIFYAYKQQEETRRGVTSTGWDTMLTAIVEAGFQIIATWPMRTEGKGRLRQIGSNALASSVVLVCRPRPEDAPFATRREFMKALRDDMPDALNQLTQGHIAPVDLAQAAIGPGMEIYSRYSSVSTIAGVEVTVRDALENINRVIEEYHRREQGELDEESQFCLTWLEQHGYRAGPYGAAELLSQAKNVSIDALRDSHRLLTAASGAVQLLDPEEYHHYERDNPSAPMTAWEGCFRMLWHLHHEQGEFIDGCAEVAARMVGASESVERLARLLYAHYDRKRDSQNAVLFNNLVSEWREISTRAANLLRQERQAALGL